MSDQEYIIYGLLKNPQDAPQDWTTIPSHINYKVQIRRVHPKEDITSGQLGMTEYFKDYNPETSEFETLVLAAYFEWVRDVPTGRLVKRVSYRRWARRDGSLGPKVYDEPKIYATKQQSNRADTRRRKNIVSSLESQAEDFGVLPFVQTMFRNMSAELRSYEDLYDPKLITEIAALTSVWATTDVTVEPFKSMIPIPLPVGTQLKHLIAMTLDYDNKLGA